MLHRLRPTSFVALLLPLPLLLAACGGGSNASVSSGFSGSSNPLATVDQIAAEKLAITLVRAPAVITAKAALRAQWLAAAQKVGGVSAESLTNLDEAVDEAVYSSALSLAALASGNPQAISILAAPHTWFGTSVPGSRVAFDNPDTIYRRTALDATATYTVSGQAGSPAPVDFNFSLYSTTNATLANIAPDQLATNADGNYSITLDAATSGTGNHIQLASGTGSLFVRDTVSEWGKQQFNSVQFKRTSGTAPTAKTHDELITALATSIQTTSGGAAFTTYNALGHAQANNTLPAPSLGGTGGRLANQAATYSAFDLTDDQALVITVGLGGAKYFIAPAYGRWLITTDYINHTQTLNNAQSVANPDGTYTYVVSPKDPGVYNWVDTVGLHQGFLNLRWQGLPATTTNGGPSASVQLVKLSDLKSVLPATTKFVSNAERQAQLDARAASYASRYAS
ncbi:hypothetical protein G7047_23290 [Diaphorobacter sp. HDW4A]|uniref:hypothetical protein n=1 Tax=Diaphorobacter sp. HDW4A TaxID=2714924 RepID=UPI00140864E0|nr:hypothetical protein [Diaphorobacter sp. HDW4A]QIL82533.1 hypothetical protein G7047_23290 [Diaphorobacter sp. HDW4A]